MPTDKIAVPEIVCARYFFLWNRDDCVLNRNFYGFVPHETTVEVLWAVLNCTFSFLQFELSSRKLGAGASGIGVSVANRMLVLSPVRLGRSETEVLEKAGRALRNCPIKEVREDVASEERRRIDGVIFDALGLTSGEREAVYEGFIDLVEARLKKAESV